MDGNDYQRLALRTDQPNQTRNEKLINAALGLAGKAGEVADHLKKAYFQGHDLSKSHLKHELGDILWYVAQCAQALDLTLNEIMICNVEKLQKRYPEKFDPIRSINRERE